MVHAFNTSFEVGETSRIGLVATGSTTFNEPYNLARQFKALDVMSHGRAGWNAVTSSGEDVAANYGMRIPSSADRYGRAHEMVQLVQALWGSWARDAWMHDQASGRFADGDAIAPINMGGKYVASRGPLYIPPSEQGQPVVFHAGGSPNALAMAGRYANALIGAAFTIEDARAQRAAFRNAAEQAGRDPDELKYFVGLMTTLADDRRAGLDRRITMTGRTFDQRVPYLGQMLGLHLDTAGLDEPISPDQLAKARPSPRDPRSAHALKIAREGWSLRDVLAHGVIDYHPVIAGPPTEAADHMQEWFEAGACDGFWVSPDVFDDGIDAFVDGVVPILQDRGLFHREPGSPILCQRSDNGYPPRLARKLGLPLVDMTCSGSVTKHVLVGGQYFQGAQIRTLSAKTRLVTLTAGGNDVGFVRDLFFSWRRVILIPGQDGLYENYGAARRR